MNKPSMIELGAGALLLVLSACGSSSPQITPQLVDARRVVNNAQMSSTAKLAPRQMDDAWHAYLAAEKVHKDDPGSYREAHLAYVAQRKAETANASAKTVIAMRTAHALDMRYQAKLAAQGTEETEVAEIPAGDTSGEALDALEGVADVKQEANSIVITLSSAVLFPTAGDKLSEGARKSLDKVAEAINAQPEGSHIRVDGYTDSRGTDTYNEGLSERRAKAVSSYLSEQGVDSAKLSAEGKGESDPIASNDTEEGRASNRRAEIVIQLPERAAAEPAGQPMGTTPGTSPGMNKPQPPAPSSSAKTSGEPEKSNSKMPMVPVPMEPQHE